MLDMLLVHEPEVAICPLLLGPARLEQPLETSDLEILLLCLALVDTSAVNSLSHRTRNLSYKILQAASLVQYTAGLISRIMYWRPHLSYNILEAHLSYNILQAHLSYKILEAQCSLLTGLACSAACRAAS